MNKKTDMDRYLFDLCESEGELVDEGGTGQFTAGFTVPVYRYCGHIYTFYVQGDYIELAMKEIDYDA